MQGCTTTGYIGILRAAPPTKSAAEKTPATPFSREEMAWTAMAAIHIVAHILRTKVDHLPRAPTSRTRLNPQAAALPQKSTHQLRSCSVCSLITPGQSKSKAQWRFFRFCDFSSEEVRSQFRARGLSRTYKATSRYETERFRTRAIHVTIN